jgi:hypothetical protein
VRYDKRESQNLMDKEKAEKAAYAMADEFRVMVLKRTNITRTELKCPRENSEMTPCIARDGGTAVAFTSSTNRPLCVGCEIDLQTVYNDEKEKAKS